MKCRTFNSCIIRALHYPWAAQVLGMDINPSYGPDLIDEEKSVELKFCLNHSTENYPLAWTVMEHQMKYNESRPAYWGLILYYLDEEIKNITRSHEIPEIENMVKKRELYLVEWNWMEQYPPHQTKKNIFRYPKFHELPSTIQTYRVKKGLVHLTQNLDPSDFPNIQGKLRLKAA